MIRLRLAGTRWSNAWPQLIRSRSTFGTTRMISSSAQIKGGISIMNIWIWTWDDVMLFLRNDKYISTVEEGTPSYYNTLMRLQILNVSCKLTTVLKNPLNFSTLFSKWLSQFKFKYCNYWPFQSNCILSLRLTKVIWKLHLLSLIPRQTRGMRTNLSLSEKYRCREQ